MTVFLIEEGKLCGIEAQIQRKLPLLSPPHHQSLSLEYVLEEYGLHWPDSEKIVAIAYTRMMLFSPNA